MGIIPDSHSEVTDPVRKAKDKTDLSQPSNEAQKVSVPCKSSNTVIESINIANDSDSSICTLGSRYDP